MQASQSDYSPQIVMIEDMQVQNKVCCSVTPILGFHPESLPFIIARNRNCINLVNVRTATVQPLIRDQSSTAWYQESLLVLAGKGSPDSQN